MEQDMVIRVEGDDSSVGSRWCDGYKLLDPLGQSLGRVERVFSSRSGEPQYVRVRAGLFAKRMVLIPVMDVAIDHGLRSITLR